MYRVQHIEYLIGLAGLPIMLAALFLLLDWKRRTVTRIGDAVASRTMMDAVHEGERTARVI